MDSRRAHAVGPIANLTGLHIFADGTRARLAARPGRDERVRHHRAGRRDERSPRSTTTSVPTVGGAFGSLPSTNAKIAVINWYTVGLVSDGRESGRDHRHGVAQGAGRLEARRLARRRDAWTATTIHYAPTSLEMLNDHPVLLGEHFRSITLWPAGFARRRARARRRRRQRVGAAVSAVAHRDLQEDRARGARACSATSATTASTTGC